MSEESDESPAGATAVSSPRTNADGTTETDPVDTDQTYGTNPSEESERSRTHGTDSSEKSGQTGTVDTDAGMDPDERGSTTLTENVEVLLVGPTFGGGIVSYITEQTRRLDGTVDVSTHGSGAPPTGSGPLRFVRGILMAVAAFLQFTIRSPPDLVHVHTSHRFSFYRTGLYVLFSRYIWGVPVVLHVHGSSFDDFLATDSQLVAAYQRLVFRSSSEIIVLSEYWRDLVTLRANEEKIRVIPNAIEPEEFTADPTAETPHVVFVSNLIERKGVAELSEAVERLADRYPGEFRVSIAGSGPLSDRVEKLAAELDEVTYFGYVSEEQKRSLLEEGCIYVLPTYAEGLPIAMLEGMAGANAVVTTAVGSIPEVIDPENGVLVEPGDVDELVSALESLLTTPERRTRMATTNRRLVEENYSWQRVTDDLLAVYENHLY